MKLISRTPNVNPFIACGEGRDRHVEASLENIKQLVVSEPRVEYADNRPRGTVELGRQIVRQLGLIEVRQRLKRMFPLYSRRELRQLASKLHSDAWRDRDREALHRLLHREEA